MPAESNVIPAWKPPDVYGLSHVAPGHIVLGPHSTGRDGESPTSAMPLDVCVDVHTPSAAVVDTVWSPIDDGISTRSGTPFTTTSASMRDITAERHVAISVCTCAW